MTSPLPTPQSTTVTVGGHTYRVNSSANSEELASLAALVDDRLAALPIGQRGDPKSLVLIALGLAHDLEQERLARAADRREMGDRIRALVARIGDALGHVDLEGNALQVPSPLQPPSASPALAGVDVSPAPLATAAARTQAATTSKRGNTAT